MMSMLFEFIYKHILGSYSEKKTGKIKMKKICLQFDIVIISPFREIKVFDG